MDREEILSIVLANLSGVNEDHIITGRYDFGEEERVNFAIKIVEKYRDYFFVDSISDPDLTNVEAMIKKYVTFNNVDYVFYDYVFTSPALSASTSAIAFNSANFFLRLLGYTFAQFNSMYINMGAIFTVPFFLLALFNKFRKSTVERTKWAILLMWVCACLGMALFGESKSISESQLAPLFSPFFAAYGAAMVFVLLGRLQLGTAFNAVRALAIAGMLLVSSGLFLFQLPKQLYMGIWTSARGIPHFPPYYPAAMNGKLHNMTNDKEIVVTDQPWAVAWYADRKALWMPLSLTEYTRNLEPIFARYGQSVQGFLITPSSHSMQSGGLSGVIRSSGDFAPLALEGKLLLLAPKHNMAFAELFTSNANEKSTARPLASLVSSQGVYRHRNFILGAEMIYYSREDVGDQNK